VFPVVAMAFVAIALNGVATFAVRLAFAMMTAVSILATLGMLLQLLVHSSQRQAARVEQLVSENNKRDRDILERLQTLNPTNDLPELLGFSNRFENPDIRKLAISKAESHPQFRDALASVLKTWRADSALVYLDACDVSPADKAFLAEAVRSAIGELTKA